MEKYKHIWNRNKYEEYVRSGRGQGEGSEYLPWIKVQNFSSAGTISRIYSYKTKRIHHLLSRNELYYFYLLEWSDKVLDIREQFPLLDLELIFDIASKTGIKYPKDRISGFPYIMTCDYFMVTTQNRLQARTIKNSKDLSNMRTLEKFEVERQYCKAHNIEWLYTAAELPEHLTNISYQEEMLHRLTIQPAPKAAEWFDNHYGFPAGNGLQMIKHLLWVKKLSVDANDHIVLEGKE